MIRALYGGSFDPVHAGHLAVIADLVERRLADIVHVLPAGRSPFKDAAPLGADAHREAMLALALQAVEAAVLDPRELRRSGPSYTVTSLRELAREHPDDEWRLVVGADHGPTFHLWRDAEALVDVAEVVVVARGPVTLSPLLAGRAHVIDDFDHPAQATEIRRLLASGRRPDPSLLPVAVCDHIISHGLYGWPPHQGAP